MLDETHPDFVLALGRHSVMTAIAHQTGGAAMSVPLARTDEGLPIGIQFGTGLGDEPKLIRLAAQLEQAQPWAERCPS